MNILPYDFAKNTDELKKLIEQYPDYPICVLVDDSSYDPEYCWTYCASLSFNVGELLSAEVPYNNNGIVCTDRAEFEENLENWLYDKIIEERGSISEEDFQKELERVEAEYEPYWVKCITISAWNN